MSVSTALARVAELQQLLAAPARAAGEAPAGSTAFAQVLTGLETELPAALSGSISTLLPELGVQAMPGTLFPPGTAGRRALALAQAEVGQAEDPPGANDGLRIAAYRTATSGAYAGAPWCAYFVSWCAAQAGLPLGESGQGFGAVEQVQDWAARTGRLLPPTTVPQPGDIILFGGRHIGFVESVNPDGSLTTVEGNYRNAVSRVQRSPAEATGFVRL
ncbi:MAG: CHAP domain-containing protein [Gaiellales bacterium]